MVCEMYISIQKVKFTLYTASGNLNRMPSNRKLDRSLQADELAHDPRSENAHDTMIKSVCQKL